MLPLARALLAAALLVAPSPVLARCGDHPGDAAALADARAAVEATCACSHAANHALYVACAVRIARQRAASGLLPKSCKQSVKRCAAKSACGRQGAVACCLTHKGTTQCKIKRKFDKCLRKGGCLGLLPSCCDACTTAGCSLATTTTTMTGTTATTGSITTTSSTTTTTFAEGQMCRQFTPPDGLGEPLPCGESVSCRLDPPGDQDAFTFTAPDGAGVSISAFGTRQTCWQLFDGNGRLNQPQCNTIGSLHGLPGGGYTILVIQQRNLMTDYVLSLQGVSESFHCGKAIRLPADTVTDSLTPAGDTDSFNFVAAGGEMVTISITGSHQPCWQLFGPDGAFLISQECRTDGAKTVGPLTAGTQTIVVNELTNQATDYTLSLTRVSP